MSIESWINKNHTQFFGAKQPIFQQDVESKPSPVPVKGWDAISPLSNMEPDYGVIVENCVPRPGWVEFRGGFNPWCQSLGGPVESILVYRPSGGNEQMFSAAGGDIWDTSLYGSQTLQLTGKTSNRWQYVNMTPAGGVTHLIAVNGSDAALIYNGAWGLLSISGVSSSLLTQVMIHKRRVWFIERNSTNAWYLATDAIAGTATKLELGSLLNKGSFITSMGTWTIDGGNGPDDYAAFISNKGQTIIYKGTDPSNADAWFLVGVFNLPSPLGVRCMTGMGSEMLIITLEGVVPLSKALPFDPSGVRSAALTNRIQNAMSLAALNGRNMFGWEIKLFPLESLLVMNVPITEGVEQQQYIMNTLTGAWCKFTGWNANTFDIFNESLYFGDNDGNLNLAYAGPLDGVSPILMDMKSAYNYYDDPGRIKIMQMCRPYIVADGAVNPTLGIDVDFGETSFTAPITTIDLAGSLWDSAIWDSAIWSASVVTSNNWQTVGAIGTALSIRMKVNLFAGAGAAVIASSVFDTGTFDSAVFDGNGAIIASGTLIPTLQFNQYEVIMEFGTAVG